MSKEVKDFKVNEIFVRLGYKETILDIKPEYIVTVDENGNYSAFKKTKLDKKYTMIKPEPEYLEVK